MHSRLSLLLFIMLFPLLCHAQRADTVKSQLDDTTMLGEIIISAKTAVKVKGDTISYTVDSFYKNSLSTAEDVLKRLPGVEVSKEGKITIQGKEVSKIFINGKEYMAEDLRTITQNLPAEVLEKIQVADWYDEETRFSGIKKNSEQKSINLQFKKKYQHGVYGRLAGGYGTKDRYQAGAFGNYMGSDLRATVISNINNTGIGDATNDAGSDVSRSANIPGVLTKKQANLNISYDGIKNLKLNGLYEISGTNTELNQSLFRTTYLPGDTELLRTQSTAQVNNTQQHRFNLRSEYKISDMLNMTTTINGNYRVTDINNTSDDMTAYNTVDNVSFQRHLRSNSTMSSPSIRLTNMLQKRFKKPGRTISLNINANYATDSKDGNDRSDNRYFMPPSFAENNFVSEESRNNFDTRVNIQYTEPLSDKSSLSANYSNLYTFGENDRQVYREIAGDFVRDTNQTRLYENTNIENPFGLTYQYNTEVFTGGAGIDVQVYDRTSRTVNQTNTTVNQAGINYFPNLFSRYKLSKSANLNANYSGSIISPTLSQLQPIPDYTDSLSIYVGNPSLKPEVSNNITLSYNSFDTKKQRTFWMNVRANWVNSKITKKVDINASRRISTYVNVDGAYNFSGSLNYSWSLVEKKIKASLGLGGGTIRNITVTNGRFLPVENYNFQPSARLTFNSIDWYEGDISYNYRYSTVNSATPAGSTVLQSHTLATDGTFFVPWGFKLGYYINYAYNEGLAANFDKDFMLVNLRLDKTFDKPKGLSVRLQAFDIFNNYPNVQRVVVDNYFEDKSFNRIGSYLMVSVIYKFSYFPAIGGDSEVVPAD